MTDYQHKPDRPWIFRTYAGHSTAAKSNALYRTNLSKGQTGLSIAFDLPTQTAYDCDHILASMPHISIPPDGPGLRLEHAYCLRSSVSEAEFGYGDRELTVESTVS